MKKSFTLILAAFIICSAISCKKKSSNSLGACSDGSANFTHLGIGHELVYAFYGFSDDTMIVRNLSTTSAGTYKSTITFEPSGTAQDIYYTACGKDLYTSLNGDYTQYGHYWLSLDANVGDSWTRTLNGSVYNYKLYSKDATVTTPFLGNTYTNCYKFSYRSNTGFFTDTIYFKPDMGIVFYDGFSASYELVRKNF
ncbi:MAG: hypothetical protein JWN78_361 [Bacteroidota bacterium]|nr:hypothetical protein [Bacteroidota bacterium]